MIKSNLTSDKILVQIALYAAIIAVLGLLPKFSIPMAGGVPISAQSMGIMLAGIMLGPVRGALAVCLFLFVVALGAPLLAGGRGGLGVFLAPSVGFLIGWPIAAFVAGLIMSQMKKTSVFWSALTGSLVGGILVLYAFGIPGIAIVANLEFIAAAKAVAIFIPGDLVKVVVTALIAQTVAKGFPQAMTSRA